MLRLSLLPGPRIPQLALLTEDLVELLLRSEKHIHVVESDYKQPHVTCSSLQPPYRGVEVHGSYYPESLLHAWGGLVESLWQVLMTFENKTAAWDIVTCRLLLWRSFVGEEGTRVGEWARQEVVRSIGRC